MIGILNNKKVLESERFFSFVIIIWCHPIGGFLASSSPR